MTQENGIAGIPVKNVLNSGVVIPTTAAYIGFKTNPPIRTGMCIGKNTCPPKLKA
jgi:hypothetical protein